MKTTDKLIVVSFIIAMFINPIGSILESFISQFIYAIPIFGVLYVINYLINKFNNK